MTYFDPYAGGFRGLQAGLDFINAKRDREQKASQYRQGIKLDREKLAQQQDQFDKALELDYATLASSDAKWRGQQRNDRTTADQLHKQGMATARTDQFRAETGRIEGLARAEVDRSTARGNDARTETINLANNETQNRQRGEAHASFLQHSEAEMLASGQTAEEYWADKGGQNLAALFNNDPKLKGYVERNHNLKDARLVRDNAGNFVIQGISKKTGEVATLTARAGIQGEGATDGTVAFGVDELLANVQSSAMQYGGWQSPSALQLVAQASPEQRTAMADIDTNIDAAKKATKDVPAQEAPAQGFSTPPGGRRSQYRNYPTPQAPAPAQQAPVEQAATEQAPTGLGGQSGGSNYGKAIGSAALGFDADTTAFAAQTGAVGPTAIGEYQQDTIAARQEAAAAATAARAEAAAAATHQRDLVSGEIGHQQNLEVLEAEAYLQDPNRDIRAGIEASNLIAPEVAAMEERAITSVLGSIDFGQASFWKDQFNESWRQGSDPRKNFKTAVGDVQQTLRTPSEVRKLESAIGKPKAQWTEADYTASVEIIALSRKRDHVTRGLGNVARVLPGDQDHNSIGLVTQDGVERWKKGEAYSTLNDTTNKRGFLE